jgi:hypothetical protein
MSNPGQARPAVSEGRLEYNFGSVQPGHRSSSVRRAIIDNDYMRYEIWYAAQYGC